MRSNNLFPWLAKMIADRFNAPVAQCWTVQRDSRGQVVTELQGMTCQDKTFPQNFLTNSQIIAVVERAAQEQFPVSMQGTEIIFPRPVAIFLKRYMLNYCTYFFLGNALFPPKSVNSSPQELSTPAAIVILLLLKQPPTQDFLLALRSALQQTLSEALDRGLLLAVPAEPPATHHTSGSPISQSVLLQLIPHRIEDTTSNPLAITGTALNAPTRRFYAAINGQRDILKLTTMVSCSIEQVYDALKTLTEKDLIRLHEPGGQLVDSSLLFKKP